MHGNLGDSEMVLLLFVILTFVFNILVFLLVLMPIVNNWIKHIFKRKSLFEKLSESSKIRLIKQLKETAEELASKKIGAIITIENKDNLDKLRTDGVAINATVSSPLLIAIFQKNSPLHDGAVIIRSNRVVYAATYYKITKRSVANNFGSRHRAALGISENSDATTIVISEENGTILICKKNKIEYVNAKNFQEKLVEHLN